MAIHDNDTVPTVMPPSLGEISASFASVVSEQKEKEKRCLNVILHNVPESTSDDNKTRKADDIEAVYGIVNNYLGAKAEISNTIRLGKKISLENVKPRLLKI